MTGLYLRCLREARGIGLEDAARTVQVSASAIDRWERAHSPIRADALTVLLRRYGVADDELDFLVRSLPRRTSSAVGVTCGAAAVLPRTTSGRTWLVTRRRPVTSV
ncbi:helix-turn-helix domain-containing protein [Streptomyces zhihengii]